jgi:chemotaxis signal transduction protein
VHDVVRFPGSEVRQLPEGVAANREYLRGVTTNAVLMLDAEQVLRL